MAWSQCQSPAASHPNIKISALRLVLASCQLATSQTRRAPLPKLCWSQTWRRSFLSSLLSSSLSFSIFFVSLSPLSSPGVIHALSHFSLSFFLFPWPASVLFSFPSTFSPFPLSSSLPPLLSLFLSSLPFSCVCVWPRNYISHRSSSSTSESLGSYLFVCCGISVILLTALWI